MLSPSEVAQFREQGFLIPKYQIPADTVVRMREDLMPFVRAKADLRNKPITDAHMPHTLPDGRDGSMLHYCQNPDILDIIESIDGPDLLMWTTTVFHRTAGDGVATPWHQDGQYWPIHPIGGTSAWIAMTPCRKANGCVRVIPGSHKGEKKHVRSGELAPGFFQRTVAPDAFDESTAVDVELDPGQMMLFHPLLIHGSHHNTSNQERMGFVMRYIPSTSFFDHEGGEKKNGIPPYADRALFVMRGVNRCARNDMTRNHPTAQSPAA